MTRRAWAALIALAAIWGSSYMFIRVSIDDVGPYLLVFVRVGGAALLLLPVLIRRRAALAGRWPLVFLTALPQVVLPFVLISAGERHVPSGLAGILVATMPLWLVVLAPALRLPRPTPMSVLGLLVGLGGVGLLMGGVGTGAGVHLTGVLMVVAAAACYAIGSAFVRTFMTGVDAVVLTAATMGASAVLVAPFAAFDLPSHPPSLATIGSLTALALVCTGGAFVLYNRLIGEAGPQKAGLVAYLAPAFAVTYGAVLLDEIIGVGTLAGLALILLGSWVSSRFGARDSRTREHDAGSRSSSRLKVAGGGRL